ncbi:hypothetical protein [Angustibacter aerolatus]
MAALAATALGLGVLAVATPALSSQAAPKGPRTTLTARCLDPEVALSVEERRLENRLPDPADPSKLQRSPFARQMIVGAGFQRFGPALVQDLCGTRSLAAAQRLARTEGRALWRQAVARAQGKGTVRGSLPSSDDRPLYWTRLQATAALRQWEPPFRMTAKQRRGLITTFDKAARGMTDISFPAGRTKQRVIVSGFDPYTLDGGPAGTAVGATGNNIRHGNPSGAIALSLDGTTRRNPDGTKQYVQAYTLPVNYTEFAAGYLEDTVGPLMTAGRRTRVTASVTVSQAGGSQFDLEQWNGRYHGPYPGNDLSQPCPLRPDGTPQLAVEDHGCNTQVVPRWGGPRVFQLQNPPQWTTSSLPIGAMIRANTGQNVPRPPGDTWPDQSVAFGVVWHTNYDEFPDCTKRTVVTRNTPVPVEYPPSSAPVPPDPHSCAYNGGGGNYLSNESAYRNTLLRDRLNLDIPAGHIHTPGMQVFDQGDLYQVSDATFDAWRLAIVRQAQQLVHVVGAQS